MNFYFPTFLKISSVLIWATVFGSLPQFLQGQISIANSSAVTENFTIGTSTTASLPSNWKMTAAGTASPTWSSGTNVTVVTQGASSGSPATGGRYNWGDGVTTTDRAIGFMSSGSYASPSAIMAHYQNTSGYTIKDLSISFDYEKYRTNSTAATLTFFTSTDGSTWTARTAGDQSYSTGTSTYHFSAVIVNSKTVSLTGVNIANNGNFYLRWSFTTGGSNSHGLGLDNVSLTATLMPTIATSGAPAALSTTYGTASASTSFSVSGANMEAGILVTPPAGFEVSTDDTNFSNTVTVGAAGAISSTTVYLRLKSSATPVGSPYSGNIVLSSTNATSVNVATTSSTVSQKNLTISGLTADNKTYDGTTAATISGTPSLVGIVGSDDVSVSGTPTATFASANAGMGIAVSVSGYTLAGTNAGNYTLSQPTGLTADIAKANQTITFAALIDKSVNAPDFMLTATASSGLTVTYTSSDPAVAAVVSGNMLDLLTVGSTNITASQAGDANYLPASDVMQTQVVNALQNQTITFNPLADVTYGDADFSLTATASSGLTVTYSSSNPAVATVSGSTVTIVGVGTTTITASQAGDMDYNPAPDVPQNLTVLQKELTTTGATADNKTYDATTAATISGASLVGIVGSDDVSIATSTGSFLDKNVGMGKPVTAALTLGGADAANYFLTQPTGLTANISQKNLTTTGAVAQNKVYDATDEATISGASLVGVESGDVVTIVNGAFFPDKNVGMAKPVTAALTLGGADGANYSLTQPTGLTANISAKNLTTTGATADNKIYDATTVATISGASLVGVILGDDVSIATSTGSFSTKTVANGKPVTAALTLGGADAGNYSLTQPTGLTANITKKTITVGGLTANSKTYDGTTAATLSGTAVLSGVEAGDVVNLGGTASAVFASANAGMGIAVTVSGYTISGTDAANYSLSQPTGLTADINKANPTITFAALPTITDYVSSFTVSATVTSPLTLTFSSSDTDVATVAGTTVSIVGPGTTIITAATAGNSNYNAASVDQTLTVLDALAAWNFNTASPSTPPVTNLTVSDVLQGNNNGTTTMLSSSSASSGYLGASGGNNAGAAARIGALNTGTSGSAYFQFSLTPTAAYKAVLMGIVFGSRSTGTGPQAYTLRSSLDNYATDIATGTLSNNSTYALKFHHPFAVESATGTAITFRLFGYNGSGGAVAGTANWRIDDLQLVGSVECGIPDPTAFTVTGGGTYCAGGAGLSVGLSNSELNTTYQLLLDGSPVGSTVAGTGAALDFGLQTAAGAYSVEATNLCGNTTETTANASISITPLPAAPTGAATQNFCSTENAKVSNLVASGSNIQWYDAASGGNLLAPTTALVNGNHYFASQTVSSCEGTARLDVSATITIATIYYLDFDGDGFGDATTTTATCAGLPTGYVANDDDCDDMDNTIFPGATETCDGIDEDCNGVVDNGFSPINFTSAVVGEGCGGGMMNGSIDLTLTAGAAPISYAWSNLEMTQDLSGLSAGAYAVTVSGAGGCTKTGSFTVVLNTAPPLGVTFTKIDVSCFGSSNGTIFSNPTGGSTPYTYLWTPTGKTTKNINLLPAGTYVLKITDASGCTLTGSETINQPTAINFTLASSPAPAPYTITVTATGGTGAYTYNRTPMTTFQSSNVFAGVANGTYIFKVKDANGCQKSRIAKVPLTGPKPPKPSNDGSVWGQISDAGATDFLEIFVFPNPAKSEVQFEILNKNFAEGQLKISDLTGRILMEKPVLLFENQPVLMDVSNLREGFYQMILVETDGRTTARNFVIQR